jgi:hypothetical protein
MTKRARMPVSVRHQYRRVAVVKLTPEYAAEGKEPLMISLRAKGVLGIKDLGHYRYDPKATMLAGYQQALAKAHAIAAQLNDRGGL